MILQPPIAASLNPDSGVPSRFILMISFGGVIVNLEASFLSILDFFFGSVLAVRLISRDCSFPGMDL